jgi:hypothetical protein
MVMKKEGTWCMCHDFQALNKLTIKEKFHIPVIDDLFDELSVLSTLRNLIFVLDTTRYVHESFPRTTILHQ